MMIRFSNTYGGPTSAARRAAFSLIEMLVVIAVIGLLAALVIGGASHFRETAVRARVQTELNQVATAIESYHKKYGFYPQDNAKASPNPAHNPLYYELTATPLDGATAMAEFGIKGIVNTGGEAKDVFPNIGIPGKNYSTNGPVYRLTVGYRGAGSDSETNPWRYVSKNPTNNTESFDLWAEVLVGNNKIVIGNWKD